MGGACLPWECKPDEDFCSGDAVRRCAADGLSSTEQEACGADAYCDAASATCKDGVCAPNQPSCDGDTVRTCNVEGTGYLEDGAMPCESGTSCDAGACKSHICTPGESFCQEQDVKLCAANGLGSTVEETCDELCLELESAALCNASPLGEITNPAAAAIVDIGQTIEFDASCSDPDGDTDLSHHWSFDGGATESVEQSPEVTFDTAGIYEVTYTCSDSFDAADPNPATVSVSVNGPPSASIDFPSDDFAVILPGSPVHFTGSCSDDGIGGAALTHAWDFGGARRTAPTRTDALNPSEPTRVVLARFVP